MRFSALIAIVILSLAGCSDISVTEVSHPQRVIDQTEPWCETHPVECGISDPDPSPTQPGLFLGTSITATNCSEGAYSPGGDGDRDGFGDYCEELIAQGFAPELAYSSYDSYMGRESYWVVRPDAFIPTRVHIAYALGYYADGGSSMSTCAGSSPPVPCLGHLGDSETIELLVNYNASTGHWELQSAQYSQHGTFIIYAASQLTFPAKLLGYPRAIVSLGKHANYASSTNCGSYDDCQFNSTVRISVYSTRNLGSSSYPIKNCVNSEENFSLQQLGYPECFWSATNFTGWSGDNSGDVEGYKSQLLGLGF
jgi:hypothetical protein